MKETIRTLKIDLESQRVVFSETFSDSVSLEERLGGFGKAVHDQEEHLTKNPDLRDAYDPRNMLSFDIGVFTGTKVMTGKRTYVSGLSPLKTSSSGSNGIYYSASSGRLGPAMRRNGLDSIQIVGKSKEPVLIVINNGKIGFEYAGELVGKTTNDKIKSLGDYKKAAFAIIGPSGEKQVRFANIGFSTSDQINRGSKHMRFAGRGGMGAVMGSKNLLGLAVMGGDHKQDVGDVKDMNLEIARGDRTRKYRELGTFEGNTPGMEALGVNIHNNFSFGTDPETAQLFRDNFPEQGYSVNDKGCSGCGIKCWKEIEQKGHVLGRLDFEPGTLLGPNLGINNLSQIMKLIGIADDSGVDSMSAGVCVGYEMQRLGRFGDFKLAEELLRKIVNSQHGLSEGVMRYAMVNRFSMENAMHVKGIELAAYPGNTNPGYAFAIAGPHTSMDSYNRGWNFQEDNNVKGWVKNISRGVKTLISEMTGLCKFAKPTFDQLTELYGNVYDDAVSVEDLNTVPMVVYLRAREIDAGLGFSEADDTLPEKCFEHYEGSNIPHFNNRGFFGQVKQGVYEEFSKMRQALAL